MKRRSRCRYNAYSFDVTIIWGNDHELKVEGEAYPFIPAQMPSPKNETGTPAEGGEIEDLVISLIRGKREPKLCDAVSEVLIDDESFIDDVEQAISMYDE